MDNYPSVLDNPIWHALTNQHAAFALGDERARRYPKDVAVFGAVAVDDEAAFDNLAALFSPGEFAGLFGKKAPSGSAWRLYMQIPVVQMVYEGPSVKAAENKSTITSLTHADVPAMLGLVELTHPGPFLPRTIELGRYLGIWQEGQLAAMAGQRLHLQGYHEISAVCTHPDFQRRGYARQLVLQLIHEIQSAGDVPFLHVDGENKVAITLYEGLGFKQRAQLTVIVLERL